MIFSEGCFLKEAPLRLPARTFAEEAVYKRKAFTRGSSNV
jgi:hypothetical protein